MEYNLSYMYPKGRSELTSILDNPLRLNKKLSAETIHDAWVVPSPKDDYEFNEGGVFRADGSFIKSSCFLFGKGGKKTKKSRDELPVRNGAYIFIGWWHQSWGHSFTDNVKKLWFLYTAEGKRLLDGGAKLVYICTNSQPLNSNVLEIIELCGVKLEECYMETEPARYETLIVPEDSLTGGFSDKLYTQEYIETISRMKRQISELPEVKMPPHKYEKVYLSRVGLASKWREVGEAYIERAFKKMGYKVVHPEQLSLHEQLSLFMNCRHFAATEGSLSHNAIFFMPNTTFEIIRKCNWVNPYQIVINQIADINVTYIDAFKIMKLQKGVEYGGPFIMIVNSNLRLFARRYIWGRPYWTYYIWWYMTFLNRKSFKKIELILKPFGFKLSPFPWD